MAQRKGDEMKVSLFGIVGLVVFFTNGAFAESIDSIKKLSNGDVQIVYSLDSEYLGNIGQYTLVDNDGMATLETVHLMLIQEVSNQLWEHQGASWAAVSSSKASNWKYAAAIEKDALDRLIKVSKDSPEVSLYQSAVSLRNSMTPHLEN